MLRDLSEAPGLPGFEQDVRRLIRGYCEPFSTTEYDSLGSIICRKEGSSTSPRIMLAGHMDEVGFIAIYITEKGFVKFQPMGGWFDQVLLAQRVVIKTSKGDVPGVIGCKPPHLMTEDDRKKVIMMKDMFIDIGAASREEASALGVRPGDPVLPVSQFGVTANGKLLMGKAWDDRAGCALFIEVLRRLSTTDHPNTVFGVGTVQEEVGLRGATTSCHVTDPDVAFALEVDIAGGAPGMDEAEALSRLGHGPSLTVYDASMVPNVKLRDLVISVAEREKIPLQMNFMARGGTDAGRIHIHGRGVPSVVISVPSRYIHSHVGLIHRDDFDAAVSLLVAIVKRLDAATVAGLKL
ncbi:MAG: M42 family metallopeptidase [Firmicutes bacterium]|nr:M42 family metallopeptidase [Bacillota bacterium]